METTPSTFARWPAARRAARAATLALLLFAASSSWALLSASPPNTSTSSSYSSGGPFAGVSPVAFGTLNPAYDDAPAGLAELLDALPERTLIDTAERYGENDGDAERALGEALRLSRRTFRCEDGNDDPPDLLICTKFAPKPWRIASQSVVDACRASIERLGVDRLFLYQLHYNDAVSQPFKLFGYEDNRDETYWEGLAECHRLGLTKYVGVCNYGPTNVRRAHEFFAERGVPLVSNQINFNLMRYRSSMETKAACDELGIGVMGYHPLGGGVLTGAYDEEWLSNVPGGLNRRRSKATRVIWYQKNCAPVIDAVRDVAEERKTTPASVAVAWCVGKGVIPLCGARSTGQVEEAVRGSVGPGGEDFGLTEEEIARLDEASDASAEYARGFDLI